MQSNRIQSRSVSSRGTRQEFRPNKNCEQATGRKSCRLSHLLLLVASVCSTTAWAQDIQIAQQRGPYYVDEPMVIQIQVSEVQAGQDVDCRLSQSPLPAGVRVDGPQIGQSKSSFSQIINGRIISRESVRFTYNFQVTADRPGPVSIGPFTVKIDSKPHELESIEVEFEELAEDPEMELEISLPDRNIYVGEQVPLTIRWLFAGDRDGLQHAFSNLQIRSPLFEQFSFVDTELTTRIALPIVTAQGIVQIDATVEQIQRDGRDYVVLTGKRMLAPSNPGTFDNIPASCRTQRVTRWGRGMFGGSTPREVVPALARAEPLSFEVLPIPLHERPASFAGAVGSGFAIEVAANRSVVRVGDPIALDIRLTGNGDLERAALPPLASSLDENLFQLPSEVPVGTVVGNAKQFKVNLRVKQATVQQLPALSFSWFDPKQEKFVTTQSKPIALQVNAAQIVSAADVVASAADNPNTANSGQSSPPSPSVQPSPATALNFLGANLAAEQHLPSLVVSPSTLIVHSWLTPALYLLGIGVVALGLIIKRSRAKSPLQTLRQTSLKQARATVRLAERQPPRDATHTVASALRQLIAAWPDGNRHLADQIIAECEQQGYAPADQDPSVLKSELVARALAAIDKFPGK